MHTFYFNDCLPLDKSEHEIISCFGNTLSEYKELQKKYKNEVNGIVTSKLADDIILNEEQFNLKNCIEGISDRELRRYAYSVFRKYPIADHFDIKDEVNLIENDYIIKMNNVEYNAMNAKIVQENTGMLFSLSLHENLRRHSVTIEDKTGGRYIIPNLFGDKANTERIDAEIQELIKAKSENFESLRLTIGPCSCSGRFKAGFNDASAQIQESVISLFTDAKERKGNSPFYADGQLIKDVTPEKEIGIKVFELRIFSPVAYRVYFYEAGNKIYLGLMEKKPKDKVQSKQIETAANILKELIAVC